MNPQDKAPPSAAGPGLPRRDVLKLGLGFSLVLVFNCVLDR